MQVGFIGTGLMGLPMAQQLLEAGFGLTAYNRTPSKLEPLQAAGASIAATPTAVIAASDCVVLMLTNAQAIRETLLAEGFCQALVGKTLIQMGTISPSESQQIQAQIIAAGGDYLEAPVLGSIPEAKAGTLLVMVGGTPNQLAKWMPVLQCFGSEPKLVGTIGAAAAVKLALNQLIGSLTAGFAASLSFLEQQEVEIEPFMQILRSSALYAPTFDKKLQRMVERNYTNPNFPTKHLHKDINLFLAEAERLGIDAVNVTAVSSILAKTLELGLADADYSALFSAIFPDS
jgi:3-hydroxyisobutyrate dehydrogenase